MIDFDSILWHDGKMQSIRIEFSPGPVLIIVVRLQEELLSKISNEFEIHVKNPSRVFMNLDINEIVDNQRSGNISDGKLYTTGTPRLILVLVEGYIEVSGTEIEIIPVQERGKRDASTVWT